MLALVDNIHPGGGKKGITIMKLQNRPPQQRSLAAPGKHWTHAMGLKLAKTVWNRHWSKGKKTSSETVMGLARTFSKTPGAIRMQLRKFQDCGSLAAMISRADKLYPKEVPPRAAGKGAEIEGRPKAKKQKQVTGVVTGKGLVVSFRFKGSLVAVKRRWKGGKASKIEVDGKPMINVAWLIKAGGKKQQGLGNKVTDVMAANGIHSKAIPFPGEPPKNAKKFVAEADAKKITRIIEMQREKYGGRGRK